MMTPKNDNARGQAGEVGKSHISEAKLCYPSPTSVKGRVLGALLRGEHLTHLDCWRRFGSSRLAHHAHVLRKAGWPILMTEQIVATSDHWRQASIGIYRLPHEAIAAAAEVGQCFAAECQMEARHVCAGQ